MNVDLRERSSLVIYYPAQDPASLERMKRISTHIAVCIGEFFLDIPDLAITREKKLIESLLGTQWIRFLTQRAYAIAAGTIPVLNQEDYNRIMELNQLDAHQAKKLLTFIQQTSYCYAVPDEWLVDEHDLSRVAGKLTLARDLVTSKIAINNFAIMSAESSLYITFFGISQSAWIELNQFAAMAETSKLAETSKFDTIPLDDENQRLLSSKSLNKKEKNCCCLLI